jgi:signal transduction histidine kinase
LNTKGQSEPLTKSGLPKRPLSRDIRLEPLMRWLASLCAAPYWKRLAIGAAAAVFGAFWRLAYMDVLGERVAYLTFYPMVMVAALLGGLVSGASATVLSALLTHSYFVPLSATGDWLGLGTFLMASGIISGIAEILRRFWIRTANAEALRAHAERLNIMRKERLTAMSKMAIALAHELNQPLAATAAYLRAARRLEAMAPEKRPARIEDTLERATEQIMRAGRIVHHMRQFVGGGEPDKALCSMHELIREACELAAEALSRAKVSVTLSLDGTRDTVLADRIQIKQILVNLIKNAGEAMTSSPQRELSISTTNERNAIRVSVADTGPGLSKKILGRLFEPFATTKASGMGVGLSVSRSIVDAHFGRMWVESKPGDGTVFSFVLPLAIADDNHKQDVAPPHWERLKRS